MTFQYAGTLCAHSGYKKDCASKHVSSTKANSGEYCMFFSQHSTYFNIPPVACIDCSLPCFCGLMIYTMLYFVLIIII